MIDATKLIEEKPQTRLMAAAGDIEPVEEPVSLEEAKKHLRLEGVLDDEDDLIQSMITAAREMAEGKLNRTLVRRQLEVASFEWGAIALRKPPFVQVDSVSYFDANGNEQTLDADQITVTTRSEPARVALSPAFRQYAPQLGHQEEAVIVRYTAGYAPGEVPQMICAWIKLVIGALYQNRESFVTGVSVNMIPEEFNKWLLQPYMVYE